MIMRFFFFGGHCKITDLECNLQIAPMLIKKIRILPEEGVTRPYQLTEWLVACFFVSES